MNINLHIERLVLEGISVEAKQRAELKSSVELELNRLLVSNGTGSDVQSNNNSRTVSGGEISNQNIHNPTMFGEQIGEAVYRGITK